MDRAFASKALDEWFSTFANVRQMHSTNLAPAGKAIEFDEKPDGHYIGVKVVEPTAIKLVDEGVYSAFSVGIGRPRIERDLKAKGGRIVDGKIVEVSLVDYPANPNAKILVAKGESPELVGKAFVLGESAEWVEVAKDGAVHHTHFHVGADGKGHTHAHTHAAGVADHNGPHEDVPHAHAHPDESAEKAAEAKDCPTCKGKGKIRAGHVTCPDCKGSGKAPAEKILSDERIEYLIGKSKLDNKDQREAADHKLRDKDGDVVFPINDCADVKDAWNLRGHADNIEGGTARVEQYIKGAAQKLGCDGPWNDGDTSDEAKSAETSAGGSTPEIEKGAYEPQAYHADPDETVECPECHKMNDTDASYCDQCGEKLAGNKDVVERKPTKPASKKALKRLHDAICPAFQEVDVKSAHPKLEKNGIAAALGPGARLALWQMLNQEVQEDGGAGAESYDIANCAGAYKHLNDFLGSEAMEDVLMEAVADLRKQFQDAYPADKFSIPKPGEGSVTPEKFRRPYISAGHAQERGTSTEVRMPSAGKVPEPEDFDRDAISAGQERQSPANKAGERLGPGLSGEEYVVHSAHEYAANALVELHDHIAHRFDELCPMDMSTTVGSTSLNMRATSMPTPLHPEPAPPAPGEKKARAKVKKMVARATKKVTKTYETKIKQLQATVEKLERMPDPEFAPYRGHHSGAPLQKDAKAEKAMSVEDREFVQTMKVLAKSGSPETRLAAQSELRRRGLELPQD